jgi:uncharacterized protein
MRILSEIYIYPIKSLGGIRLNSAVAEERGLQYDRRWMLTDADGQFLSQRAFPQMALLDVALSTAGLRVTHRQQSVTPLSIPLAVPQTDPVKVVVWDDTCEALPVSQEADDWFSEALGKSCRLVYMPDSSTRRVEEKYVPEPFNTSFSDGYPLLIIGQASLDYLNGRLDEPLPINRFRPNLVFTGGTAHEEDTWCDFRVGAATFRGVKLCGRCIMTTINQQTGEKGQEPLRTLSTLSGGMVQVGDRIEIA